MVTDVENEKKWVAWTRGERKGVRMQEDNTQMKIDNVIIERNLYESTKKLNGFKNQFHGL